MGQASGRNDAVKSWSSGEEILVLRHCSGICILFLVKLATLECWLCLMEGSGSGFKKISRAEAHGMVDLTDRSSVPM